MMTYIIYTILINYLYYAQIIIGYKNLCNHCKQLKFIKKTSLVN